MAARTVPPDVMQPDSPSAAGAVHAELLILAELAPLGVLDSLEQHRLGRHLREGCAFCDRALDRAWRVLDVLALATPPLSPSPGARERLRVRVALAARTRFPVIGGS